MNAIPEKKAPWYFLPLLTLLVSTSCHLVIGLEKKDFPDKSAECGSDVECDDGHACTRDKCELSSRTCTHHLWPEGTKCRPPEGDCDLEEKCDGTDPDCPPDSFKPATEVCRDSIDPEGMCDPAEYCIGDSAKCPDDVVAPEGAECDDRDECTYGDACDGEGACEGVNGLSGATFLSAAAAGNHTCSLLDGCEARCWGAGGFYQLGSGAAEDSAIPVAVSGLPAEHELLQVSCGGSHTCVLVHTGEVMCWGRNESGQLGNTLPAENSAEPVEVEWITLNWDYVSAGGCHTCAIHRTDGPMCWGCNDTGQLGDGTTDASNVPRTVALSSRASRVAAGSGHTCAVLEDGRIQCWGDNTSGQLGNEEITADFTTEPADVQGLPPKAGDVSLGLRHTCALLTDGEVMCWGDNTRGQLGAVTEEGGAAPVAVVLPSAADAVSSGDHHTCALLEDGAVMCWGAGNSGQLGDGNDPDHSEPVSAAGLPSGAAAISCGSSHSCALLEEGILYCWGSNSAGQLGDGTTEGSLVPVQVCCR